jgi:tRNA threonylcarbamoyladenosine biosynthesis protein TsaE
MESRDKEISQSHNCVFECHSPEDTKTAAEFFAKFAKSGQYFALYGDLGYGKTTFAKYFIKYLNPAIEDVPSPTFTIVQTYHCDHHSVTEILHVDCYRLNSKEEFLELGLDEGCERCVIIEWPEIIQDLLPKDAIKIEFSIGNDESRVILSRINHLCK